MSVSSSLEYHRLMQVVACLVALLCCSGILIGSTMGRQRDLDLHVMSQRPTTGTVTNVIDQPKSVVYEISVMTALGPCKIYHRNHLTDRRGHVFTKHQSINVWLREESCYEPLLEGQWRTDWPKIVRGISWIGLGLAALWFLSLNYRVTMLKNEAGG